MLIDLLDRVTGRVSRKWLIGRRMVLDLSESNESRVAVVELPLGTFSFDVRDSDGKSELVLMSEAGSHVVATYSSRALAIKASKRIKFAMTRPLKRVVWACLGVLIVFFTFDVATTPRSARVAAGRSAAASTPLPAGLTQEQLGALLRQRQGPATGVAPPAAGVAPVVAGVPGPESEQQGSPEAQAAIRLLRGK